jgi:nitroreductase
MPNDAIPANPAATGRPLVAEIKQRWSPRAFDPDREIDPETLTTLLEAARWAPSSFNDQPWRYLVFDRSDQIAREKAESCLFEGNSWARNAAVLIISAGARTSGRTGKPNRFALHDTGMATMNLILQAISHGLVSHQMGGYDRERARAEFDIPEEFELASMIAVGYPGDPALLAPEVGEREAAPRRRRQIPDFVFAGTWDRPLGVD